MDHAALPSWTDIISRIASKSLRRGRGQCPFCDSKTGFSVHDGKGFYCFSCGVHGDKISFIEQFHKCDFKNALRFFGIEPGVPPKPDPAILRKRRIRAGLRNWARTQHRILQNEFYLRYGIEIFAKKRLRRDAQDFIGWELLSIAYAGIPVEELERRLDLLIGIESQQLELYRELRAA